MANVKISGLPAASAVADANEFEINEAGTSKKVTGSQIVDYVDSSLGLGTISTQDSNNVSITGGSITGITDLAVADGGTGSSSLTANNVLLGNGTSALQTIAPGTSGNVLTSNGTTWTSAAPTGGGGGYDVTSSTTATDVTLTSSSTNLQNITFTAPQKQIILPDATTLSNGDYFAFNFPQFNAINIATNDSGDFGFITKNNSPYILVNNSTSAGHWTTSHKVLIDKKSQNPTDLQGSAVNGVVYDSGVPPVYNAVQISDDITLHVYDKRDGDWYARAYSQSSGWGSEVLVVATTSTSYPPVIIPLTTTKCAIFVSYGNTYNGFGCTLSGTSLSIGSASAASRAVFDDYYVYDDRTIISINSQDSIVELTLWDVNGTSCTRVSTQVDAGDNEYTGAQRSDVGGECMLAMNGTVGFYSFRRRGGAGSAIFGLSGFTVTGTSGSYTLSKAASDSSDQYGQSTVPYNTGDVDNRVGRTGIFIESNTVVWGFTHTGDSTIKLVKFTVAGDEITGATPYSTNHYPEIRRFNDDTLANTKYCFRLIPNYVEGNYYSTGMFTNTVDVGRYDDTVAIGKITVDTETCPNDAMLNFNIEKFIPFYNKLGAEGEDGKLEQLPQRLHKKHKTTDYMFSPAIGKTWIESE